MGRIYLFCIFSVFKHFSLNYPCLLEIKQINNKDLSFQLNEFFCDSVIPEQQSLFHLWWYIINIPTFFFKPCKIVEEFGCHHKKARRGKCGPHEKGWVCSWEQTWKPQSPQQQADPFLSSLTSCILQAFLHPFLRFLSSSVAQVWLEWFWRSPHWTCGLRY